MEKMRISKIIVALLVSVVAVTAMTGVAVAMPATVTIADNPIINPLDGTVTTTTVTVTDIDWGLGDPQTRHISVITDDANLYGNVTSGAVVTGLGNLGNRAGGNYTADSSVATTYTFTLHVNGTCATHKHITVADNNGTAYSTDAAQDSASCTRPVDIPEFATIAIPAIAVLGLFLFFNKRKHKKA